MDMQRLTTSLSNRIIVQFAVVVAIAVILVVFNYEWIRPFYFENQLTDTGIIINGAILGLLADLGEDPEERMRKRLDRLNTLPSLPTVVGRLMKLIEDPDSTMGDLEVLLNSEPSIVLKLRQVANSAAIAGAAGGEMSLKDAITRLGTNSAKWDSLKARFGVDPEGKLPMWVADMEFAAPPAVNAALLCGHTTLRVGAMDDLQRGATDAEIASMRDNLAEALEAGAIGMSTGLYYPPANAAPRRAAMFATAAICRPRRVC